MGREAGRRVRVGNTCTPMADSCECMAKPPQYCKVVSLQLKREWSPRIMKICRKPQEGGQVSKPRKEIQREDNAGNARISQN